MGKPSRGEWIDIEISELDEKGHGVGRWGEYTVRVRGAIPGDQVRVSAFKIHHRKRQIEARVESLLRCDINRRAPRCSHFGLCGGCLWQDVPYPEQVILKQNMLKKCLETAGIFVEPDVTLEVETPFYYRNKMEFSFGISKEGNLELGLHVPGRFDRVFDLNACHLQSEQSNNIVSHIREFAQRHRLSAYDLKKHEGLLRFLTIREGKNTGETMVILTTSGEVFPIIDALSESLKKAFPTMTCLVQSINSRKAQVAIGDDEITLLGQGHIQERLGDFSFDISPRSFFQTNTHQAERLYQRIVDLAAPLKSERVLDVYCGTGGISLFLAKQAGQVLGIEVVEDAIRDAEKNSVKNGVNNCVFRSGKAEELLDQLCQNGEHFDVAITDPPRVGMHHNALLALMQLRPSRIVYVSCNPQAFGQDLAKMEQSGYRTEYVQLVDMFPHTPHCEVLAKLVSSS